MPESTIPLILHESGCFGEGCVVRVVVTILVGVQALLPPGMCLCQFVPSATHRQELRTPPAIPPATATHTDDSCCSCPACRPMARTDAPPPGEQTTPDLEAPHEHHPLPTPAAPCSGCPVVAAGPLARAVILDAPEQAPLANAVHFVAPLVEVVSARADRPYLTPIPAASPLFVSHCAFLI
jgi:hypothetical protein